MFRNNSRECSCEMVRQIGVWDSEDQDNNPRGGPQVRCLDCGTKFNLTWDQWKDFPVTNKTE